MKKEKALEILAEVLTKYDVRKHICINGWGHSQIERDIVDALVKKPVTKGIKLSSRHLKSGDKIIRTDGEHSTYPLTVVSKNSTHIKLHSPAGIEYILPIRVWESNSTVQWVRFTL